jgi:hypothetical protein
MGIRAGWQIEPYALVRETVPGLVHLDHTAGRSRMGQSPYPGSRGLNPLSIGPPIIRVVPVQVDSHTRVQKLLVVPYGGMGDQLGEASAELCGRG